MKKLMILLAAAAMFGGCKGDANNVKKVLETPAEALIGVKSEVIDDANEVAKLRSEAVEILTVGANSYRLEAYLWRDFMPTILDPASPEEPGPGRPLIAINWLVDENSAAIPSSVSLVRQYVINGDQMWVTDYTNEEHPSTEAHKLEKVSRGGPKWGPDVNVDVVAEVSIGGNSRENGGKRHLLIRKNVHIDTTY